MSDDNLADRWENGLASRLLLGLAGALLLNVGFRLFIAIEPQSIIGFIAIGLLYGVAILLIHCTITDIDLGVYGRWLAGAVLAALLAATLMALTLEGYLPRLGTDALAFSKYASELVLAGKTPYGASMLPATEYASYPSQHTTPRIDGSIVQSYSYPAGSFLAFAPLEALRIQLRVLPIFATVACGALITIDAPRRLALIGPAALISATTLTNSAAGGIIDAIWLLPFMLSMREAYRRRWMTAGFAYGLAASVKQQPWIAAPFLLIFLYKATREDGNYRDALYATGSAAAAFIAVNLPFIITNPSAWLSSVVTPIAGGAPMVNVGLGMTLATMLGLVALPTWWYTAAVGAVTTWMLAAYWLYWEDVKWIAWVAPMAILFFHYRSLASYFSLFIPVAIYAILLNSGVVRDEGLSTRIRRWVA
ncbi:glycosyltransferase 87 family protein [Halobacterium hubeiense]|uniref:glycosyltransferase 87 family protein n=1 Tax=Halobacterium hubeiense TaxID=1407499 RepID=UPI003C72A4DA